MLKCPVCQSELELYIGFTGADWDTVAGDRSGFGYPISLKCPNADCARIFPLVHVKNPNHVSVVKDELRHFKNYNV